MGNLQTVPGFFKRFFTDHDVRFTNVLLNNSSTTARQVVTEIQKDLQDSSALQRIHRRASLLFDVTPTNEITITYCESLINIRFHGQKEITYVAKKRNSRPISLSDNLFTLAHYLRSMDLLLRNYGSTDIRESQEEFIYYMHGLMTVRKYEMNQQKFKSDARRFLEIYEARGRYSAELRNESHWGSRQQLIAGKVIADFIDPEYGPLDPVFGVLLCPQAGYSTPPDNGLVHSMFGDSYGPLAYHTAVHDAFGYLFTFHSVGPGYDYLDAGSIFKPSQCMSGQISGLVFWKNLLDKNSQKSENYV